MKSLKALFIVAIGLSTWLGGCKVRNPGSLSADSPPTTTLSIAPRDNSTYANDSSVVNYYVTLAWSGNDADGTVAGFNFTVDSTTVFTPSQDTTIAFYSPRDSVAAIHHLKVLAVDNAGLVDNERNPTTGAIDTLRTRRNFYTINRKPTVIFGSVGIANRDSVSQNFRVSVTATVPRPSTTQYSLSLDDPTAWGLWTADSVFAFASPDLLTDPLFPQGVFGMSNAGLTTGRWHVIYARSQDAGGAVSDTIRDSVYVSSGAGFVPTMDTTVTATYGTSSFYPDGSVYYVQSTGQAVNIGVTAQAPHKGEINAYRYRTGQFLAGGINWNAWSGWQVAAALDTSDLPPGDYPFQFMARDLANNYTDTVTYVIHLVQQTLSDSVIIVEDTKNGNGTPGFGSPLAGTVNAFYDSLLIRAGVKHRLIQMQLDPLNPDTTRRGMQYLSPYDVRNVGLLLWHMDNASGEQNAVLANNRTRLLSDYLGKGGRAILGGWDLIMKFDTAATDTEQFSSSDFGFRWLKSLDANRVSRSGHTVLGLNGAGGFSGIRFDTAKVRTQWHGALSSCWVFDTQGQDMVIGQVSVSDSATNPLYNHTAGYIYDLSYRIAVFGIPLYFVQQDQLDSLFYLGDQTHSVLPIMMQGLSPGM